MSEQEREHAFSRADIGKRVCVIERNGRERLGEITSFIPKTTPIAYEDARNMIRVRFDDDPYREIACPVDTAKLIS